MSRPCFALSVMLCCMVGPLLVIGKTQAGDTIASTGYDPGECIVCPLAHGSMEACGGYSDFDYNHYWYAAESDPPLVGPEKPEAPAADPEIAAAELFTEEAADESVESSYDDYYADYVFGDSAVEAAEPVVEEAATSDTAETVEDEYGWFSEDTSSTDDYFDAFDDYEPIAEGNTTDAIADEASDDYQSYEEEWFSYGEETSLNVAEVTEPEADEAYDSLSNSADDHSTSWGDEEDWYREEYGYEPESSSAPAGQLETGYDDAYDEAMEVVSDTSENAPETASSSKLPADTVEIFDDYESYYDAYDDLYNFESDESPFSDQTETAEATRVVETSSDELALAAEPAWLAELVARMLSPIWANEASLSLNPPLVGAYEPGAAFADECAHYWDCEAGYWAPEEEIAAPSVVLGTADTLDHVAQFLQDAADMLRDFADTDVVKTARTTKNSSAR